MTVTDRDLVGCTDALTWATDFCERFDGFVVRPDQADDEIIDVGGMFAWFANAIMAGFDEGYTKQQRDIARMKYALDHGWNQAAVRVRLGEGTVGGRRAIPPPPGHQVRGGVEDRSGRGRQGPAR